MVQGREILTPVAFGASLLGMKQGPREAPVLKIEKPKVSNLPITIFEQDHLAAVPADTSHGHLVGTDHEVRVDHQIIHAQFPVFLLSAAGGALHRIAVGWPRPDGGAFSSKSVFLKSTPV